jgi:peptidoglycan/LPS O-acetylase OafA/YrhL
VYTGPKAAANAVSQPPPVARTELSSELASAAVPFQNKRAVRIPELDGLRGIAILLVLGFHYSPATGPLTFLTGFFASGWIGVDLFFVLSGYLIAGILLDSAGRPRYYRNFVVRRSLRIFPLYYACMALYCILKYLPSPVNIRDFLTNGNAWWYLIYLGNIQTFLQNSWPGAAILTPLWSLQVEEQFYLSFPFIVKLGRKRLAWILAGCVIGAPVLRIALAVFLPQNLMGAYTLMPCRIDALAMGGLVAIAGREWPGRLKGRWIGWLTAASTATVVLFCILWNDTPWSLAMRTVGFTALDLAFTGILMMLIGWRQPLLLRLCRMRVLVWVGTVSYGLYLLHLPALVISRHWVAALLGIAPNGSAAFFVTVALAIAMAWISWTLFESPILRLRERLIAR